MFLESKFARVCCCVDVVDGHSNQKNAAEKAGTYASFADEDR